MRPRLSELEVQKDRVREGGERKRGEGGKRERERQHLRLPAAEGFFRELGRNEMRSSYLYSRCKGLVRIAYYSRQSLSRSLNKRWRYVTAPES